MTDPVSRAARRQNALDRIAEQLTEWGCPADAAHTRAAGLLHIAEQHGWQLPTVDAPPLAGRGSTEEGRALARLVLANTRAGCRCEPELARALVARQHPVGCPVRDAHDVARIVAGRLADAADLTQSLIDDVDHLVARARHSSPQDKINGGSGHTDTPRAPSDAPAGAEGVGQ